MNTVIAYMKTQPPSEAEELSLIDPEAARAARELRHAQKRAVGLLPATPETDVLAAAEKLGRALAFVTGSLILVFDPERKTAELPPEGSHVLAVPITENLVALAPKTRAPTGDKVRAITQLRDFVATGDFYGALIDLSGCAWPGELATALSTLDAVLLVGQAGSTTEKDLRARSRPVPPELLLGVLLLE